MVSRIMLCSVIGLCLASVLASCGGEERLSAEDYRAQLAALEQREEGAHADVEQALRAKSVEEIRERFARFADDQERLGDDVENLNPPSGAEDQNTRLARGAHQFANEIGVVVAQLSGIEDSKATKAALDLVDLRLEKSKGAREVDAALFELRRLGYRPND